MFNIVENGYVDPSSESDRAVCISDNTLEKGQNSTFLLLAMGKQLAKLDSWKLFNLGMPSSIGEGNLWINSD